MFKELKEKGKALYQDERGGIVEYVAIIAIMLVVLAFTFGDLRDKIDGWIGETTEAIDDNI